MFDLGHVTLANVSDWSEENIEPSQPQLLQDIDDDDDGRSLCCVCVWRERERESW